MVKNKYKKVIEEVNIMLKKAIIDPRKQSEIFDSHGWITPIYTTNDPLSKISYELHLRKDNVDNYIIKNFYSKSLLVSRYINRYSKIPYLCDYREIVLQSLLAHSAGLNAPAIMSLVNVIDGFTGKLYKNCKCSEDHQLKLTQNRKMMEHLMEVSEYTSIDGNDEFSEIMNIKYVYFQKHFNRLYDQAYDEIHNKNCLRRHGMSHGRCEDNCFASRVKFYKLITLLDMLCYISNLTLNLKNFNHNANDCFSIWSSMPNSKHYKLLALSNLYELLYMVKQSIDETPLGSILNIIKLSNEIKTNKEKR